jgi:hypothetical protein
MLNLSGNKAQLFQDLLNSSNKSFNTGLSFQGPQIAADVLIPDASRQFGSNVKQDYPQLPERGGDPYRAFGLFGNALPADSPAREYGFITEGDRGPIIGMMNFVPGGIPASEGFNYEESLKKYPNEMKGILRGNMPVYHSPY